MANPLSTLMPPVATSIIKPQITGFASRQRAAEEKEKSYIVNEADIFQGRITFEQQRAQNLVPQPQQRQYGMTLQQRYSGIGSELGDPTVDKSNPAWWQKALGVLEPLRYLEIPAELLAEAVLDPISIATGSQMSWARGSAEREQYEGWKGLFGGDADPNRTGFGELFARFDIAAGAFEKRPLKAQLVIGALQIGATMGAGALVKATAVAGGKASLLAKTARAGAMVIDPFELPIKLAGKGIKKLRKTSQFTDAYHADGTMKLEPTMIGGASVDEFGLGAKPLEFWQDPANIKDAGRKMFAREDDRYSLTAGAIVKNNSEGGPIRLHDYWSSETKPTLPPILQRGNDVRKLIRGLWNEGNKLEDVINKAATPEASLEALGEQTTKRLEAAAVQIQLSAGARPNEIGSLTFKQMKDYVKKGTLTARDAQGRARRLSVADGGESLLLANQAMRNLEDYARLKNVKLADDIKIFKFDRTKKSLFNTNKDFADSHPLQNIFSNYRTGEGGRAIYEGLPINANTIRQQRATEMYLEGYTIMDIAQQLGHDSTEVTRGYLRDVISIGDGTIANERVRLGTEFMDRWGKGTQDKVIEDRVKAFRAAVKAGAVGDQAKRAKGKGWGVGERLDIAVRVGEEFMNGEYGRLVTEEWADEGLKVILAKFDIQDVADPDALLVVQELARLQGLRRVSQEMGVGIETLQLQKDSIYKHRTKIADAAKGAGDKPGLLNRAGFWLNKETNALEPFKDVAGSEKWANARKKLADELNVGDRLKTPAQWKAWAEDLMQQHNDIGTKLEGFKINITGKSGKSIKTAFSLQDSLYDYVDVKTWDLYTRWMDIANQKPKLAGELGDIIIAGRLGEDAARLAGEGISPNNPITRIMHDMHRNPLGEVMGKDAKRNNAWGIGYQAGRKEWEKQVAGNSHLEGMFTTRADLKGRPFVNAVHRTQDAESIQNWLADPEVIAMFKGARIRKGASAKAIKKVLVRMQQRSPNFFGKDFATLANKADEAFKAGDSTLKNSIDDWIETLGNRISANEQWWTAIEDAQVYEYFDTFEKIKMMEPLRARITDVPDKVYGVTSTTVGGHLHFMENMVNRIRSGDSAVATWLRGDSTGARVANKAVGAVWTALSGGRAGIARPITKYISARAKLYFDADQQGQKAAIFVKQLGKDLGIVTDDATDAMKLNGIDTGQEFFGGLKVKDDLSTIEAFEDSVEGLRTYAGFAKGDARSGGTLRKLRGVTREGARGDVPESEVRKYLTQVDVVLERIQPQHWNKYFDLTQDQHDKLKFLKDILFQVDDQARSRGVDIVGTIQDRGGEYLTNYFPRLYQGGGTTLARTSKQDSGGVLNTYAGFFEAREQRDILDVLAKSMTAGASNPLQTAHSVMQSIDVRVGQYVETMWKTAIDKETVTAIQNSAEFAQSVGARSTNLKKIKQLNNIERLLNDKIFGWDKAASEQIAAGTKIEDIVHQLDGDRLKELAGSVPELSMYLDMFQDGGIASVRKAGKIANEIRSKVADMRHEIDTGWGATVGKNFSEEADWINSTASKLSLDDQRAISQYLAVDSHWLKPVEWLARAAKTPTQFMRYVKAGLDMGAPLIHGFNSLIRAPIATDPKLALAGQASWLKGTKNMFKFFYNPDFYDEYVIKNMDSMTDAAMFVRMGSAEPLQAMDNDMLQRIRKSVSNSGFPTVRFLDRFETGFSGYLDVLRTELWQSMKPSLDRDIAESLGQHLVGDYNNKVVLQKYHDLGAVINKMTGVFDPELAQQTPFQKMVENNLLFFAPMYRRATFGIIADIFGFGTAHKSGLRFREGLRQLSGMITVGGAMGWLAEMSGNNDRAFLFDEDGQDTGDVGALDMTARFGKWQTNGMQVGIGTAWWTAFRVASDISMWVAGNDDSPGEFKDWKDHPVVKFMQAGGHKGRSQFAPFTGLGVDIILGKTFTGDPLRDSDENDWGAQLKHVGQSVIPFWLDGFVDGDTGGARGTAMGAEFFGLQAYRQSSYDKLQDARQNAVVNPELKPIKEWVQTELQSGRSVGWRQLPNNLKTLINNEDTGVYQLFTEYNNEYGPKSVGNARLFREYDEVKAQIQLQAVQHLAKESQRFELGLITGRELQQAVTSASMLKSKGNDALLASPKFAPVNDYFAEMKRNVKEDDNMRFTGDVVKDAYWTRRNETQTIDEDGDTNWTIVKALEEEFWAEGNNAEYKDYVEDTFDSWIQHLPTIKDFQVAKETLRDRGYWTVEDRIWGVGSQMSAKARAFLAMPRSTRQYKMERDPELKYISDAITKERERIRKSDQVVDELMVTWYDNEPKHIANMFLKENLRTSRGTTMTSDFTNFEVREGTNDVWDITKIQ